MNNFTYRKATLSDSQTIVDINNQRTDRSDEDGFILDQYTVDQTNQKIKEGVFFYIIENANQPVAYLELAEKRDWRIPDELQWVNERTKDLFLKSNYLYLDRICSLNTKNARGAGSYAYQNILPLHKARTLYCFIVTKPVLNLSSINFHEKNGFFHTATFTSDEYAGFNDYQCRMYSNIELSE